MWVRVNMMCAEMYFALTTVTALFYLLSYIICISTILNIWVTTRNHNNHFILFKLSSKLNSGILIHSFHNDLSLWNDCRIMSTETVKSIVKQLENLCRIIFRRCLKTRSEKLLKTQQNLKNCHSYWRKRNF